MQDIIEKAKAYFFTTMTEDYKENPYGLIINHVPLVEQEMKKCLKKFPEANEEIALLGVWLHDVGYYPLDGIEHAVRGEERARKFLEENNIDIYIINQVCHCVRAHRCRDVQPETLEAKLVAFSDSASHLVDSMYINLLHLLG
jgi:HD superfamily phosphodiesterase